MLENRIANRPSQEDISHLNYSGNATQSISARIASAQKALHKNMTSDKLSHLLEARAAIDDLETTNIARDSRIAASLQGTQDKLKKSLAKSNLYHALARRPSVVELIESGLLVPNDEDDYEHYYASQKYDDDQSASETDEDSDEEEYDARGGDYDAEFDTEEHGRIHKYPGYEQYYDDEDYAQYEDDEEYADEYEAYLRQLNEEDYQRWLASEEGGDGAFSPTAGEYGYDLENSFGYDDEDYDEEYEAYLAERAAAEADRDAQEDANAEYYDEDDIVYDEEGNSYLRGDYYDDDDVIYDDNGNAYPTGGYEDDEYYYNDGDYGSSSNEYDDDEEGFDPYSQYVTELGPDEQVYADDEGNYYVDRGYKYLVPVLPEVVEYELQRQQEEEDGYYDEDEGDEGDFVWVDEKGDVYNNEDVYVDANGNYFARQADDEEDYEQGEEEDYQDEQEAAEEYNEAADAAEARSYSYYYTRLLLQVVAGMGRVGELSILQKGALKDMIVDQAPEVMELAEDYLNTNDDQYLKEGLLVLVS